MAIELANSADAVIVMVGLQSMAPCGDSDCGFEAEQHDRYSITLPKPLEDLCLAVIAGDYRQNSLKFNNRNKTAVVLVHGGALAISKIKVCLKNDYLTVFLALNLTHISLQFMYCFFFPHYFVLV